MTEHLGDMTLHVEGRDYPVRDVVMTTAPEPIDRVSKGIEQLGVKMAAFTVATGKLRAVICAIRRRYPHVVRWQPRSRVYRNWNGTVRRKNRA